MKNLSTADPLENFPWQNTEKEKILFLLQFAVLAPSTHNTQPWRFQIDGSSCNVLKNPALQLPEADSLGRDMYISLGCAIENFILAAKYFGVFKKAEYPLQGDLVARITTGEAGAKDLSYEHLVHTMPRRKNARGVFEATPLPIEHIIRGTAAIKEYAKEGVEVFFLTEKSKILTVAELTEAGLRSAYRKPAFRREMARWMHHNLSSKREGIPGYTLRIPLITSFLLPSLLPFLDFGKVLGRKNRESIASVPLACLFTTNDNTPLSWVWVGRAAERLMLEFQSQGIQTSIFVAAIEMGKAQDIQKLLGTNRTPQFLFCAGFLKGADWITPKHTVQETLLSV